MVYNTTTRTAVNVQTNPIYTGTSNAPGTSGTLGDATVTLGKGEFPPATDTKSGSSIKGFFQSIANFFKQTLASLTSEKPLKPAELTTARDKNTSSGDVQTVVMNKVQYQVKRDFATDKGLFYDYCKGEVAKGSAEEARGMNAKGTLFRANEAKVHLLDDNGDHVKFDITSPNGHVTKVDVYDNVGTMSTPIFNHYASPLSKKVESFTKGVSDGESSAYVKTKLKDGASAEKNAQAAVRNFDKFMTTMFGGTDDASLTAAANKAPQKMCDLLAVAMTAVDDVQEEDGNLDAAAAQKFKSTAGLSFLALKTINPIFLQAQADAGDAGKTNKAEGLSNTAKLFQNICNGINPDGNKEPVTPEFRQAFGTRFDDWSQALTTYLDKVAARGAS